MRLSRRNFLKGIATTALAGVLGAPVYNSLLEQHYTLTMELTRDIFKYIHCRTIRVDRGSAIIEAHIDKRWIQDCVLVTDQHGRRWSIVGEFAALRSPEGWEFPLDTEDE